MARQPAPQPERTAFRSRPSAGRPRWAAPAILGALALGLGVLGVRPTPAAAPPGEQQFAVTEVRLIWGRGADNSDPELLYHRERWFCALRERGPKPEDGGVVRVLSSPDARIWQSNSLLQAPEEDLRRPSLSAAPDGRLVLVAEAHSRRLPGPPPRTFVWTSSDGRDWEGPVQALEAGILLKALSWRFNLAYAFGVDVWEKEPVRLYTSSDGLKFALHATAVAEPTNASQWFLFLTRDGKALAIGSGAQMKVGESRPPYRAWSWRNLSAQGALVAMAEMPDGRIAAAVARQDSKPSLALAWLNPEDASWSPFVELPAKGTGLTASIYPQGKSLLAAFSSEHEGRRMVYMAEVLPGGK